MLVAHIRRYIHIGYYYNYKLVHRIGSVVLGQLAGLKRRRGIVYGAFAPASFSGTVVFAFWDRALVHLGDQLFNEPCISELRKQYRVIVCAHPSFSQYFSSLGYEIMSLADLKKEFLEGALFISKDDMLLQVLRAVSPKNFFLGMDYGKIKGDERITAAIIRTAGAILQNIQPDKKELLLLNVHTAPRIPEALIVERRMNKVLLALAADPRKFVVFNNYVASNFLDAWRIEKKLYEMARKKKAEGYAVIHAGSVSDKQLDARRYDFVDVDVRGALDPYDLFALFSLPNVIACISFDTYIMHVASVMQKELYVAIKYRAGKEVFQKRFVPMYPGGEELLKEIY